ncbi:MAG: hypothetical protein ACTSPD_07290 [Promethearchaeota archaeon]
MVTNKILNSTYNNEILKKRSTNIEKKFQNSSELACDICYSTNIIETREGYVCRSCGIVLEIEKLEYHKPYNEDIIQYAVLGATQIGSKGERLRCKNSIKFEKLNKLQSIKDNIKTVFDKARLEISRIFTCLDLPVSLKDLAFKKFKKIYSILNPGTKYRSPEKLVPIVIYFTLKLQNISINEKALLEVSKISKKDFNAFKLQIYNFVPHYAERNRKDYILQRILEISEHFKLGMHFFYQSKKILYKLWESIKNTKDDVIAGLISSITVLCSFKEKVNINAICKRLGIRMSTIHSQVRKKIFERFKISGFISLVKSSDLLEKLMNKMGLIVKQESFIENEISLKNPSNQEKSSPIEIVEIQLGNVYNVFNNLNKVEYYFYILKDNNDYPLFISLKSFTSNERYNSLKLSKLKSDTASKKPVDILFEIKLYKFYSCKDPPLVN